nr:hypothetical protein [Actinotalea sp. C106]
MPCVPSYRLTLTIGALRPGVTPEQVLPAAAEAARERTTVEAWDLAVVRGEPRISVRYTAQDDGQSADLGRRVRATVSTLADVGASRLDRRYGPRWHRLARFDPSY